MQTVCPSQNYFFEYLDKKHLIYQNHFVNVCILMSKKSSLDLEKQLHYEAFLKNKVLAPVQNKIIIQFIF